MVEDTGKDVVPTNRLVPQGCQQVHAASARGWNIRHQLAEALSEQGSAYHQTPDSGQREVRHLFLWAKERSGTHMECLQR